MTSDVVAPATAEWNPSSDQAAAYEQILSWVREKKKPVLTLGGLAGVGKTFLVGHLSKELGKDLLISFATPTGKAAQVLKKSMIKAGAEADVVTLHSLLYRPIEDKRTGRVLGWEKKPSVEADLIIVDEASMVSSDILRDLMALGKPVLAVGDHGQLSPVGEDAGLMANPDIRLEKIHRQAKGNPIIRLAHMVRNGAPDDVLRDFITDIDDDRVRWTRGWDEAVEFGKPPGFIITHTNRLRRTMNLRVRGLSDLDEYDAPVIGETVICLKNRKYEERGIVIPNGMRGIISSEPRVTKDHVTADVTFDEPVGEVKDLIMCRHQFLREKTFAGFDEVPGDHRSWFSVGLLADYGAAITGHKSQGSSAPDVSVFVERSLGVLSEDERRRWLYTAVSRAQERVLLVF